MKIYEVLWEETEYGYTVAMDPPMVFTTRKLAEQAAKLARTYGLAHGYVVRETELLDALPYDIVTREIGHT